jgi:hypothetical protein
MIGISSRWTLGRGHDLRSEERGRPRDPHGMDAMLPATALRNEDAEFVAVAYVYGPQARSIEGDDEGMSL